MSFDLFQLVPAVYRLRDAQIAATMQLLTAAEQSEVAGLQALTAPLSASQQAQLDGLTAKAARGPLQSLLMVIDEQLSVFAADLDQLYDDQFIETCAPWVIPYIGDLIGFQPIEGITASVDNPRSEVAETISFRRRKGTVLVLEQLARDVTGWGAHAVEFFRWLEDTQYVKHVRSWNCFAPDVRGWEPRFYRDSGFSRMPRSVDVRAMATPGLPRYNIQNVGIFLWSLGAYTVTNTVPSAAPASGTAVCYRLHSLGIDAPLYHLALSQGERITVAATPVNVPDRLTRLVLCADLQGGAASTFYGQGASLALYLGGQLLNPYQIQVANLSGNDGAWSNAPTAATPYQVLLDPDLGRLALPPGSPSTLTASYCYGFNAPMGGGEYERDDGFTVTTAGEVFSLPDTYSPARYGNLQDALSYVVAQLAVDGSVALEVDSSATFTPTSSGTWSIDLPAGATVELRAQNGRRPTLLLDGELSITGDANSAFLLNGFVVGASSGMTPASPAPAALVHVPSLRPNGGTNLLAQLTLTHCTLVPGWSLAPSRTPNYPQAPALIAEPPGVNIVADLSICGAVRAAELVTVSCSDSIIDATDRTQVAYAALDGASGGGGLTLQGCSVVGKVHATELTLVSNSIIWAALVVGDTWVSGLVADRKQVGCVRFSFLPVNAVIPRHFKCVEQALASPQPVFFSVRYGDPAYLKMLACTDNSIRRGADDGGEMGAFHFVLAPQRESDLSIRLQEYLPVGLDVGLIYQT